MGKIIAVRAVGHERTEEEKLRRHLHGDKGAMFSKGKRMCIIGDISGCVTVGPTKDNMVINFKKPIRLFNIYNDKYGYAFAGNVWSVDGIAPGLTAMGGGERIPMIMVEDTREKTMEYVGGRQYPHGFNYGFRFEDIAPAITTSSYEHNNFLIFKHI